MMQLMPAHTHTHTHEHASSVKCQNKTESDKFAISLDLSSQIKRFKHQQHRFMYNMIAMEWNFNTRNTKNADRHCPVRKRKEILSHEQTLPH